jgi:rhodanese-related sulfurtransferase
MTLTRLVLLLPPAMLIAACSGEHDRAAQRKDPPSMPFGFELAAAGLAHAAIADDDTAGADNVPAPAPPPMIDLTPEQLAERLKAGNIRLIDVRTDAEVAGGMIPGAEHIPLDRFDPAKLGPDDGREVVLYCRSGRRSTMAGEKLSAALGKPVEHLEGGILAWEAAGKPLEKQ